MCGVVGGQSTTLAEVAGGGFGMCEVYITSL